MAKKEVKKTKRGKAAVEQRTILDLLEEVLVDTHTHSKYSFDGCYDISYMMWEAIRKDLGALAVTDHNSIMGIRDYLRANAQPLNSCYFREKNTFFIPGVEVTCRVPEVENLKGNSSKIHLLAYGCDWSEGSPISRLMAIKSENDRLVDIGKLDFILKEKGLDKLVPDRLIREFMIQKREETPGFTTLGFDAIVEFFEYLHGIDKNMLAKVGLPESRGPEIRKALSEAGISIKSNRSLHALYSKAPNYSRLNLTSRDVIDIIHASGGIAVMAHPGVNMKRTNYQERLISTLETQGIDGYEIAAETPQSKHCALIRGVVRRHGREDSVIYTAGSDTHSFNQGMTYGEHKGKEIFGVKFQNFFETLYFKQVMREKGSVADSGVVIDDSRVEEIVSKYERMNEECKGKIMDSMYFVGPPRPSKVKFVTANPRGQTYMEHLARGERPSAPSTPRKVRQPKGFNIYTESGETIFLPENFGTKFIDNLECLTIQEYNALKEFVYSEDRDMTILQLAGLLEEKTNTM
ncbi:MAG: PHP domain-containing protein [Clostridiales bacterium]|nr:PHP domain-containing protein [Clostridiales bacterium]